MLVVNSQKGRNGENGDDQFKKAMDWPLYYEKKENPSGAIISIPHCIAWSRKLGT